MLMCYAVCFANDGAFAVSCKEGQYPYLSWCHDCIEGCYCTGPGIYHGAGYLNSCNPSTAKTRFGALEKDSGWNNVYTCPSKFPKSPKGAKSAEDCYADIGGKPVYNKSIKLEPGKYLPINSNTATKCKTNGNRYYCPGGMTVRPSFDRDQGIKECPSGQKANSSLTGCETVKTTEKCNPGYYLPKNATSCKVCKSRYYLCIGGTFPLKPSSDQGIRKCDGNLIANSGHTQCVASTQTSVPQTTTTKITKITLTKNQMKFGLKGAATPVESQCWTKYKNKGEYISCVMKRYY